LVRSLGVGVYGVGDELLTDAEDLDVARLAELQLLLSAWLGGAVNEKGLRGVADADGSAAQRAHGELEESAHEISIEHVNVDGDELASQ